MSKDYQPYEDSWVHRAPREFVEATLAATDVLDASVTLRDLLGLLRQSRAGKRAVARKKGERRSGQRDQRYPNEQEAIRYVAGCLVRLRESLARAWPAITAVEEEFGAVADGIAEYRLPDRECHIATSIHRLIVEIGEGDFLTCVALFGDTKDWQEQGRCRIPEDLTADELTPRLRPSVLCELEEVGIVSDDRFPLEKKLVRELFREWKRKYPTGKEKFKTVAPERAEELLSRLDPTLKDVAGRRPTLLRNLFWLKWKENEELSDERIRDRWNSMTHEQREKVSPTDPAQIEDGPLGADVVSKGLKRARAFRDSR
jgi:hypothetical protein